MGQSLGPVLSRYGREGVDVLVGDQLSEDRACCDNPEACADAPHVSAKDGDDFVSEELPAMIPSEYGARRVDGWQDLPEGTRAR